VLTSAEYDDLIEQMESFRKALAALLADMDAEIEALQQTVLTGKPVSLERIQNYRDAVRKSGNTFEKHKLDRLPEFRKKP